MPTVMKSSSAAVVLLALALLGGCGSDTPGQKVMPLGRRPPKVPATQAAAIDEALRVAAKAEIGRALHSNDPILKAHAIESIQDVLPAEMQNDVWNAMKDDTPLVRFAAVMAVGAVKLQDAKPELLQLVDDPQSSVRVAAVYALHRLGDYRYSKDLQLYSQDANPEVRANTALVLGLLGDPSAANVLRPMRRDKNAVVRLQVAEALWRLGDQDGLDTLIAAAVSRYPDDQMVATVALGGPRDTRVRQYVRDNLTADYFEVTLVAARVMGQLDSDEGYGIAVQGVKSSDPRHRALAALAFGAIGRPDAQQYLAKLIKDGDPEVRIAAATGILQLKRS